MGSEHLGEKATHYSRDLAGIAQAMEKAREVNMLAIHTDSKPGISTLTKLDRGLTPPRSEIEARELTKICAWPRSRLTKRSDGTRKQIRSVKQPPYSDMN